MLRCFVFCCRALARLRRDPKEDYDQTRKVVNDVLDELKLNSIADAMIGSAASGEGKERNKKDEVKMMIDD